MSNEQPVAWQHRLNIGGTWSNWQDGQAPWPADEYRVQQRELYPASSLDAEFRRGLELGRSMGMDPLANLRADGWSVAVHNDYRQAGAPMTFWLFTHPTGRWIKGEGGTDVEAIAAAIRALAEEPGT